MFSQNPTSVRFVYKQMLIQRETCRFSILEVHNSLDKVIPGYLTSSVRMTTLVAVILLQAASAIFFIGDFFWEFHLSALVSHTAFEGLATLGLVSGVLFGVVEMGRIQPQGLRRGRNCAAPKDGRKHGESTAGQHLCEITDAQQGTFRVLFH